MQIHVARGGEQLGVFAVDDVRKRLTSGEFRATDLGWSEGRAGWTALSQFPDLLTSAATMLPPPLPPPGASPATGSPLPGAPQPANETTSTSAAAVTSLICGILSFTILPFLAAIPAVICGHIAHSRIKRAAGRLTGNGLATAGLILGYLAIASIPFFAGMAVPIIKAVQVKGKQSASLSQGQKIATACRIYALDNEGAFPKRLEDLIPDYLAGPESLVCPIVGNSVPVGYEYYGGRDSDPPSNILLVSKAVGRKNERVVFHVDTSGAVVRNMPALPPHSPPPR